MVKSSAGKRAVVVYGGGEMWFMRETDCLMIQNRHPRNNIII
jgi:hypothetical protein